MLYVNAVWTRSIEHQSTLRFGEENKYSITELEKHDEKKVFSLQCGPVDIEERCTAFEQSNWQTLAQINCIFFFSFSSVC